MATTNPSHSRSTSPKDLQILDGLDPHFNFSTFLDPKESSSSSGNSDSIQNQTTNLFNQQVLIQNAANVHLYQETEHQLVAKNNLANRLTRSQETTTNPCPQVTDVQTHTLGEHLHPNPVRTQDFSYLSDDLPPTTQGTEPPKETREKRKKPQSDCSGKSRSLSSQTDPNTPAPVVPSPNIPRMPIQIFWQQGTPILLNPGKDLIKATFDCCNLKEKTMIIKTERGSNTTAITQTFLPAKERGKKWLVRKHETDFFQITSLYLNKSKDKTYSLKGVLLTRTLQTKKEHSFPKITLTNFLPLPKEISDLINLNQRGLKSPDKTIKEAAIKKITRIFKEKLNLKLITRQHKIEGKNCDVFGVQLFLTEE